MKRSLVLEAAYEAVSDSLEWGIDCKDGSHSYHIDGICAVVDILLKKIDEDEKEQLEKANMLNKYLLEDDCDNSHDRYEYTH